MKHYDVFRLLQGSILRLVLKPSLTQDFRIEHNLGAAVSFISSKSQTERQMFFIEIYGLFQICGPLQVQHALFSLFCFSLVHVKENKQKFKFISNIKCHLEKCCMQEASKVCCYQTRGSFT